MINEISDIAKDCEDTFLMRQQAMGMILVKSYVWFGDIGKILKGILSQRTKQRWII